ncbi:MAG: NAD-dependent epimerase/dehydratase family protein [Gammaproteobacteria bacterium]
MIFIIGGRGFIGSAIARKCSMSNLECQIISRDNYQGFVGKVCDILVNANGNARKYIAQQDALFDFDASVRSVRASLVDFQYRLYVLVSSADVYPDPSSPQATLEAQAIRVCDQNSYGFHKHLAEQCVQHVAANWLILRLGGLVGPGLKKNPIHDIVSGAPLRVDPRSEMQFMSTDQTAAIAIDLIDRGFVNEVFNVSSSGAVKLLEAMDLVGYKGFLEPESPRVRYELNVEKLSELVELPSTRQTVFDFVEHERKRSRQ